MKPMKTHTNILYILLATFLFFPIYHTQGEEVAGSPQGTFNVTPMGGASYSVAIDVPPGHGNMLPQIAIAYNSQSGMGIAGWGCNVSGISSITCGPHDVFHDGNPRGLKHDGSDAYYLDGVRLLYTSGPIGQSGCIYHPEGDPYTEVITCGSNTSTSQGLWFEMHTSTGLTIQFGNTSASRQDYTKDGQTKTNAWYVSRVEDQSGNYMEYSYTKNQLYVYPSVISYGSNSNSGVSTLSTVEFSYTSLGSCAQPFRIDGVAGSMNYRLSSIVSKTARSVFRTYTLTYDITSDGTAVKFPRLQSITEADAGGNTLGPVTYEWEPLPAPDEQVHTMNANLTSDSYWLEVQEDRRIHAADVTGDGIPNLIEVVAVKEQSANGWTHPKYMNVFDTYIGEDGLVHTDDSIRFYVNEVYASFFHSVRCGPFFIDMNGDGKNEIIMAHSDSDPSGDAIMAKIYDINRSPRDSMVITSTESVHSDDIPLMCVGDFNNDGYGDFAALETGVYHSNIYWLHILQGANTTSGMGWTEIQISLPSAPKKLFFADMDSDGFQDLLILYNNGYKVIKNQAKLNTSSAFNDTDPYRYTGTNVGDMLNVEMGDFNGDGVADLLMNPSESGNWYYALGNGDCTFTKNLAATLDLQTNNTSNDDNKYRCIVTDIDQDGKSDAIVIKAMYDGSNFLKTHVVWLLSNGTTLTEWRRAQSNKSSDALCARYTLGDFDGDGVEDLMNWGFDCSGNSGGSTTTALRFYLNPSRSLSSGKVTSVADGYGEETRIEYGTLVDSDVYTQENGSSFPVTNLTVPLHVVKQTESDNGVASAVEQTYQYAGLRLHRLGKGLLGFRSISVSNLLTGTETTTETVEMDTLRFVPLRSRVTTTLGNGTATVETTMTATECGYRNYSLLPASRIATDFDDNTITTIYNYHREGYPLSETTYYGSSNNYDKTTYSDYVKKGTVWLPQTVETERRNSASQPVQTRRKTFSYDTRGLPVETVENAHSSLALTTTATYDAFGNVLSTTTSGNGVDALTKYYTYDTTGRFVTSTYTTPASASTTYTYDTWGNVLTETGTTNPSAPLTTTYTYDGFGNLIEEESPLGVTTTYTRSMGYDSSQGCTLISLLQQTDGQPWTQTWTDPKGRETLTESVGAGGIDISASKDYDSRGRLSCSTSQNGNVTVYVDYTYDNRDRVTAETHSTGRHINYVYANRQVTATVNDSCVYVRRYDARGNMTQQTDPVTTVAYTYTPDGQLKSAWTDHDVNLSMAYDDVGNRTAMSDTDSGTTTYEYDALGRLTKHTDAFDNTTAIEYDALGRVTEKTVGNVTTTYTYGTTGNEVLRLTAVANSNGTSVNYTHNAYGQVTSEVRHVGNEQYPFQYEYNTQGHLSKTVYPEGLTVTYGYDTYGYDNWMKVDGNAVWQFVDNDGQEAESLLGGTLTHITSCDSHGLPLYRGMKLGNTVLHEMYFQHAPATGNLLSRTGMTVGDTDVFTYDKMDRLVNADMGGHANVGMSYGVNGNIMHKDGVGDYNYGNYWQHPHAMKEVYDLGAQAPVGWQDMEYNALGKPASIYDWGLGQTLTLAYGPDGERWSGETRDGNNNLVAEYRYIGDVETVRQANVYFPTYYYHLGHNVLAVDVHGTVSVYYMLTDPLGSVTDIYTADGTPVFKATYDPWGQQTVALNTIGYRRGYCGHEMLQVYGLINMNARLYDPVTARFLAPDNYVQDPTNSQNFNRYSYCLNNSLKYTDPSGEWFGIDDLLIAGTSFVLGYIANGIDTGNWGWKSAMNGAMTAVSAWIGYNTCGISTAGQGITQATWNQLFNIGVTTISNALLPSVNIPINNHWGLGISLGFGYGDQGLSFGWNVGIAYVNKDFSIGVQLGNGTNYSAWRSFLKIGQLSLGYGMTCFESTYYGNHYLGSQFVGTGMIGWGDVSFILSNDLFAEKHQDRWRTSAAELTIGDISIGSYVLTNDGQLDSNWEKKSKDDYAPLIGKGPLGAWLNGDVYSSPIWFGIKHKGQVYRYGYSSKYVQTLTQNAVHKYISPTPFFIDYDKMNVGFFSYFGYNNAFSLWNY